LLNATDLAGAMEVSRLAGWKQTIDDRGRLVRLDPQGCLAIEVDDRIEATTPLCYGSRLAWIGMVLTKPDYRRPSLAQRLVETALERPAALKIASAKLDAAPEGQPPWEKLGFKTEQIVERWFHDGRRDHSPTKPFPGAASDSERERSGCDRQSSPRKLRCICR
jgi:ribosomal protein S18 acetylase RimI-like enzyme